MERPEEKIFYGGQDVDGRIILKYICRRWVVMLGTGWFVLKIGTNGGLM